jgi:hypothetical protein
MTLTIALTPLWLVTLWRLPVLRGTSQQRYGTLVLLFITASATTMDRAVRRAIDSLTSVADLTILLGHFLMLSAIVAALELAAAATGADRSLRSWLRRSEAAIAAAMACMVVLFIIIPRRQQEPDFGGWHSRAIEVISYEMLVQACLGIGLCVSLSFLARHWRSASRGPLRTTLLLLWLGAAAAVGYVLQRMWNVLKRGFGEVTPVDSAIFFAGTFILLPTALVLGCASTIVPLIHRYGRLLHKQVDYHRLGELWTTLTAAAPGTVLAPPPHPLVAALSIRSTELLLYRRAVEIRDAQMELTSHVPPQMRDAVETVLRQHGHDDLALDACYLHIGLYFSRRRAAHRANPDASSWSTATDLDGEVAGLLTLARLIRNPIIADAAAQILNTYALNGGPSRYRG